MTIKDFFDTIPSGVRMFFNSLNTNIMSGKWTATGGITNNDLYNLSERFWIYNFDKDLSPTVERYAALQNINLSTMTASQMQGLLKDLFLPYQQKWIKLWENVYLQTYNPIWNVEGSDSTVRTFEHGKTTTETKDFTIEHGRDSTDTETVTDNITDNDVYGFNSSSPVGASKSTNNGERTTEYTGSDTDTHSGTDTFANSGVDTERTTLTRGMNLGIQSTQSLLEAEIELREKFKYFDIVLNDVTRELAVNVY